MNCNETKFSKVHHSYTEGFKIFKLSQINNIDKNQKEEKEVDSDES